MTTKIVPEPHQHMTVIRLRSELTQNETGRLRDLVLERCAERAPHFVLEMSELRFIDSEGLAALLWIRARISEWGGRLRLVSPTGEVRQILKITRLQDKFQAFEEMEGATRDLC
jgi:anti-anti-sigma factor